MIVIGLGCGRSGTASLANLIDSQDRAICFHELNPTCAAFEGNPRSVLNTVGLAIGVGCMIVAILYFDYHLQYNAGHENEGRIHRVIRHVRDADGTRYDLGTRPVGPHLKEAFPEVEEAVRVLNREMWVSHGDRGFNEWVATVDSSFARVFTVPMVRGDARTGRKAARCDRSS